MIMLFYMLRFEMEEVMMNIVNDITPFSIYKLFELGKG